MDRTSLGRYFVGSSFFVRSKKGILPVGFPFLFTSAEAVEGETSLVDKSQDGAVSNGAYYYQAGPGLPPWEVGVRSLADLGELFTNSGTGIGIVLGIGPSAEFPRWFLRQWKNGVLYLCDPFIHIFSGYDDLEFNVDDRTHQANFENIRTVLVDDVRIQGRYSMVREFSFSFFGLWTSGKFEFGEIPPRFVYVDNNPHWEAIVRDMSDWWQDLLPGGVMAGPRIQLTQVQKGVEAFIAEHERNGTYPKGLLRPLLFLDEQWGPGWMLLKPHDDEVARHRKKKEILVQGEDGGEEL